MSSSLTAEQKTIHFLDRTSFGAIPDTVQRVNRVGMSAYLDEQLEPEKISDNWVEEKVSALKTIRLNSGELFELYPPPKLAKERGMAGDMMRAPRMIIYELQQARLLRAVQSQRQLNELMVDFWNNHFNIFAAKGADRWLTTSYDRDTIRPHALGKFRDLLLATAKSPAMLFYLDNWLSVSPSARMPANARRRGLNENYGRELMELHTLGVDGGYTQQDVINVARAFTGWTMDRDGNFRFVAALHDTGEKIVLGHKIKAGGGIEDGEQVLDIVASHPATAHHIAFELAQRLVADEPPPALVDRAAARFRETKGDLREVVKTIVTSPEFLLPGVRNAKFKMPFEFVVSAVRTTGASVSDARAFVQTLQQLCEPLYMCQPPTGYHDTADAWVSAGGLVTRMNFATRLASGNMPGVTLAASASPAQELAQRIGSPEFQRY